MKIVGDSQKSKIAISNTAIACVVALDTIAKSIKRQTKRGQNNERENIHLKTYNKKTAVGRHKQAGSHSMV